MILNIIVFGVTVCGDNYIWERKMYIYVCVVTVLGDQYRKELILNITVLILRV